MVAHGIHIGIVTILAHMEIMMIQTYILKLLKDVGLLTDVQEWRLSEKLTHISQTEEVVQVIWCVCLLDKTNLDMQNIGHVISVNKLDLVQVFQAPEQQ